MIEKLPDELLREIRKAEIRLQEFVDTEKEYVETVKVCLERLKELNSYLETLKETSEKEKVEKARDLRMEAVRMLSETLKKGGEAEHERSHLLESYGDLLLSLEEDIVHHGKYRI